MYKDDIEYARGRLVGTIVRHGVEPVIITGIKDFRGRFRADVQYLKNFDDAAVYLQDLNLESCPLGYVNSEYDASYCMRKPMRNDWRQGIRSENLYWKGVRFRELPYADLRNTIVGEYPTLKYAKGVLTNGYQKKMAFSRDFALDKDSNLFYKEIKVGSFKGIIELYEQFKYLIEYATEVCDAQNS